MKKIELFEPAMCCASGVCGPAVDPALLTMSSVFQALSAYPDVEADRYNLSHDPDIFAQRKDVLTAMGNDPEKSLPLTMIDGKVVKSGAYPTLDELSEYTGLVFVRADDAQDCCGGQSGCC